MATETKATAKKTTKKKTSANLTSKTKTPAKKSTAKKSTAKNTTAKNTTKKGTSTKGRISNTESSPSNEKKQSQTRAEAVKECYEQNFNNPQNKKGCLSKFLLGIIEIIGLIIIICIIYECSTGGFSNDYNHSSQNEVINYYSCNLIDSGTSSEYQIHYAAKGIYDIYSQFFPDIRFYTDNNAYGDVKKAFNLCDRKMSKNGSISNNWFEVYEIEFKENYPITVYTIYTGNEFKHYAYDGSFSFE